MIAAIIIILGALFWLLMETNWLTIRLPTYTLEPTIEIPDLRNVCGIILRNPLWDLDFFIVLIAN